MKRRPPLILLVGLLLAALAPNAYGSLPTLEAAAARRCHPFRAPKLAGHIRIPNIRETSGAVASRRHKHTLWIQQDSGPADGSRRIIYAIRPSGRRRGAVMVENSMQHDWEDIAYWDHRLWIGDIGDNGTRRTEIQVYWFGEPRLRARHVTAKKLTLTYPGRTPHNAEAMFVTGGHLFIVTKVRGDYAQVFRADVKPLRGGAHRQLSFVRRINIGGVTAADSGRRGIIIKNHMRANFYPWAGGHRVKNTLGRRPCVRPTGKGEAVALATWNNSYFAIPEGANPPIYLSRPR
jgi:hypothetical protein